MIEIKSFQLIRTNIVLVISSIIVGIIISISAQYFAFFSSEIYLWIQERADFSLFKINELNLFPFIACIFMSILVCLIIKFQNIQRWHGPADTIYAAHQKGGTLDIKLGFTSTIVSFFSISGGASVGLYGPLVHLELPAQHILEEENLCLTFHTISLLVQVLQQQYHLYSVLL